MTRWAGGQVLGQAQLADLEDGAEGTGGDLRAGKGDGYIGPTNMSCPIAPACPPRSASLFIDSHVQCLRISYTPRSTNSEYNSLMILARSGKQYTLSLRKAEKI